MGADLEQPLFLVKSIIKYISLHIFLSNIFLFDNICEVSVQKVFLGGSAEFFHKRKPHLLKSYTKSSTSICFTSVKWITRCKILRT